MNRVILTVLITTTTFCQTTSRAWASMALSVKAVALSGQQAAGYPEGVVYFLRPQVPYLDVAGRVVFRYDTSDPTHTGAWWETGPNALSPTPFERFRDPAADAPGYVYWASSAIHLGDGGGLAFTADLALSGINGMVERGVFVGRPGEIHLSARTGVPLAILGGGTFDPDRLGTVVVTNGSNSVFNGWAHLNSSSSVTPGLWVASGDGSLQTLALAGGSLSTDITPAGMDQSNHVGIRSNRRLYVATPGNVQPIPYGGLVYGDLATYTADGAWLFVDYPSRTHLWGLTPGGLLGTVAMSGAQVPDMTVGTTFNYFNEFTPSHSGNNVIFRATVNAPGIDPTQEMSFVSIDGQKRLLARAGLQAPQLGPDVFMLGYGAGAVNDAGQIIFAASLTGPGVNGTNDNAIWYDDGDAILHVLLREGDPLVFDGQSRIVQSFWSGTGFWSSGGRGIDTFNDAGQFVCGLTFTDGSSGVFLFQIPEPSSFMTVAVGSCALLMGRSRRRKRDKGN